MKTQTDDYDCATEQRQSEFAAQRKADRLLRFALWFALATAAAMVGCVMGLIGGVRPSTTP